MTENKVDIVLVDDNPDDAGLVMRILKKNNFNNLIHLMDGEEALNYLYALDSGLPKLILLDLKMPKIDGLEVLQKIKSDPVKKIIPIVMLTSSREEKDIVKSYHSGVNGYIVKPVEYEKFNDTIQQVSRFWLNLNQLPTVQKQ